MMIDDGSVLGKACCKIVCSPPDGLLLCAAARTEDRSCATFSCADPTPASVPHRFTGAAGEGIAPQLRFADNLAAGGLDEAVRKLDGDSRRELILELIGIG